MLSDGLRGSIGQQFAGVHDVVRVEGGFDGAHQPQFGRAAHAGQPVAFDDADTVFGGYRAAAGEDVFVNDGVDGVFIGVGVVACRGGQEGVVVQAAVAEVAEEDDVDARERLAQRGAAAADKFGDALDGQGDVVFDADAETALGGGDVFAQRPQGLPFACGLGEDAVVKAVLQQVFGEQAAEVVARFGVGRERATPGMRAAPGSPP